MDKWIDEITLGPRSVLHLWPGVDPGEVGEGGADDPVAQGPVTDPRDRVRPPHPEASQVLGVQLGGEEFGRGLGARPGGEPRDGQGQPGDQLPRRDLPPPGIRWVVEGRGRANHGGDSSSPGGENWARWRGGGPWAGVNGWC